MPRILFPLMATAVAVASVAPAGRATMTPASPISFVLERDTRSGELELNLTTGEHDRSNATLRPDALAGLDPAILQRDGARVTFALVREPGRLDCVGTGAHGRATGACRFAPDAAFADFLSARGIARPSFEQAFQLAMTGASRALVQAIAEARYPAPTPGELAGLAALGVTRDYITALAARGYRPARISALISFKAVGVTPDYVDGLRRSGYQQLEADEIVQFRALGVSPAYLGELATAGYRDLPAGEVVQLRALGITGAWLSRFPHLPVAKLVQMKALGVSPADLRAVAARP